MTDFETVWKENFPITFGWEAMEVLEALETEFIVLGKRIRKTMKDYMMSIPNKLGSVLRDMGKMLTDAFRVDSMEDYTRAAAIYGQELAGALYQVQLSFAGLKIAVIQAAAPLVQVLLPVVQVVIEALTGLAQAIGYVLRTLFFGTAEVENFSQQVQGAVTANRALQRSLAGFDEINRLADKTQSVSSGGILDVSTIKPLGGAWKALGEKIVALMEPLKKIDLGPASESLERLRVALEPMTKALFEGLEWAWYNIFVPLAEWAVEELLPVFLDTLTVALENLAVVIEELKPYFTWFWENCLKPWAQWKAGQIISDLEGIQDGLRGVSGWAGSDLPFVEQMVRTGKKLLETLGGLAQESAGLTDHTSSLSGSFQGFLGSLLMVASPLQSVSMSTGILTEAVGLLAQAFSSVTASSNGAFAAIWTVAEKGWFKLKTNFFDPLTVGVSESGNTTVGVLRGAMLSAEKAINFIVKALNGLSFTVPSWIPGLGGKEFSFNLRSVTAPNIPQLAKGAVLPANRPFLAVVGDQRHGTNVEAPLSVIQEAVATVMEDYAAGNLAGHEATVSVLQELLAAVLGISIGDETIAAAVERHNGKMAVVHGGF